MAWLVLMGVLCCGLLWPSGLIWRSAEASRARWLAALWGLALGAALLVYGVFPPGAGQAVSARARETFLADRDGLVLLALCLVPWLVVGAFQWWRHGARRRVGQGRAAGGLPDEEQLARNLIAAVDRGGIPLNPAKVNDIARRLGLEVTARAPVEETVERIRAAVGRFRA